MSTQAVTSVLGLLFWALAARSFTVEAVGVAGASVAAMSLIGALGTVGLGTLLISRIPQTDQGSRRVLVRTALAVAGGAATLLAVVVPLVAIHVVGAQALEQVAGGPGRAALFAVGTGLMAVAIVVDQAVLVLGSGAIQLQRNAVASAVKVLALLALAALGAQDGMAVFAAWAVGTLVSLPVVAWRTRGGRALESGRRLLDPSSLRGLGRAAAGHHALNTTLQAPLQLLPVLVVVLLSTGDNGLFSTALQLTGFVFALPYALAVGLFAAAENDPRQVLSKMRVTIPLGLGVSALAVLALLPLAPLVLSLFGEVYADEGADVLRLLVLAGMPFVVKDHFVALRRTQGRTLGATGVLLAFSAVELLAAAAGARAGGLEGLVVAWLVVVYVQAVVLVLPLWSAARRARAGGRDAPAGDPSAAAVVGGSESAGAALLLDAVTSREAVAPPAGTTPEPATGEAPPVATEVAAGPADRSSRQGGAAAARRVAARAAATGPGAWVFATALGLLATALAVTEARGQGDTATASAAWVLGLVLMVAPAAVVVLLPGVRRSTLVAVALAMALTLQVSRLVLYPTRFMFHDELIHATVLRQIDDTGRLGSDNPLLPITGFYPGLGIATHAVTSLTGVGDHLASVVVLLAARLVLTLALLGVVRHLTGSTRVAAGAVVLYACNPQMLFFNSQFSYQTLALPLAVLVVHLLATRRRDSWSAIVPALLALAAVVATHHVTTVLVVLALAAWSATALVLRRREGHREALLLAGTAVVGAGLFALSLARPGNTLASYLGAIATSSGESLSALSRGERTREALFANSAGSTSQPWEQVLLVAAVLLTAAVLVPAVLAARTWVRRRVTLAVLLVLVTLLWPVVPGGHLTHATAEVGDRAAGFVYVGAAFLVAWWALRRRRPLWVVPLGAAGVVVAFLGGVVLGAGPVTGQLPGPFRISADARSVDETSVAAAEWMAENLPPGTRVYANRVNGLLAASDGGMYTVRNISTEVDASRLLLDPQVTPGDAELVQRAGIRYLVVDRRDANGLPNQQVYVENGEFGQAGRTEPVPLAALTKFDDVPGVDRIYDNGAISIYDLEALDSDR
ncbi:hypothetical protein [uncultured Pseudokineococcus sp.]|uniref:hypothetical protein n=1 Tax=uncultured Pseudokineococcus sp. TaxID=1642928 RepID=UPI0026213413|nr:hypothetical protein [uncultured Pseudokineococcus sp.]